MWLCCENVFHNAEVNINCFTWTLLCFMCTLKGFCLPSSTYLHLAFQDCHFDQFNFLFVFFLIVCLQKACTAGLCGSIRWHQCGCLSIKDTCADQDWFAVTYWISFSIWHFLLGAVLCVLLQESVVSLALQIWDLMQYAALTKWEHITLDISCQVTANCSE